MVRTLAGNNLLNMYSIICDTKCVLGCMHQSDHRNKMMAILEALNVPGKGPSGRGCRQHRVTAGRVLIRNPARLLFKSSLYNCKNSQETLLQNLLSPRHFKTTWVTAALNPKSDPGKIQPMQGPTMHVQELMWALRGSAHHPSECSQDPLRSKHFPACTHETSA